MDTLTSMDLFVKAVETGSFSATARQMSLTPSAVSKQISRLEDRLSAPGSATTGIACTEPCSLAIG